MLGPASCEVVSSLVARRDLDAVPSRLLEVIADGLVFAATRLEPVGESSVQRRAGLLGHCLVRGVPKERVTEGEQLVLVACTAARKDEVLSHQREQTLIELRSFTRGEKLGDGGPPEGPSFDRAAFEDCALQRMQPVDPSRQQRANGGGHRTASSLRLECHELLEKERIALCHRNGPGTRVITERLRELEMPYKSLRVLASQRRQREDRPAVDL